MTINESMKWPTDKARYDANYLRIYGTRCEACKGRGYYEDEPKLKGKKIRTTCLICLGVGFIEKPKNEEKKDGKMD